MEIFAALALAMVAAIVYQDYLDIRAAWRNRRSYMLQRMRSLTGPCAGCPTCNRQPKHVHVLGADRHFIECSHCEFRSPRAATLPEALAQWDAIPRTLPMATIAA